jgi:hypothetical protein
MGLFDKLKRIVTRSPARLESTHASPLLDAAWKDRDTRLHACFGTPYRGQIATPSIEFLGRFFRLVDPCWTNNGVYAYEPTPERTSWVLVTAGLSTPWDIDDVGSLPASPEEVPSGLGMEVVLEVDDLDHWAINVLNGLMAYQIAVSIGDLEGRRLEPHDRIPLKGMGLLPGGESMIQAVATTKPVRFPHRVVCASGSVDLLQIIGITRREYAWSIEHGITELLVRHRAKWGEVTGLSREELPLSGDSDLPGDLERFFR